MKKITAKDIVAYINQAPHKEWVKVMFYMYGAGTYDEQGERVEFEIDSPELDKMAEIYLDGYRYDIINNENLDDLASLAIDEVADE